MLRRDAANERLQKINPAALWGEASEMDVACWHFSDMLRRLTRVRNARQTGHHCQLSHRSRASLRLYPLSDQALRHGAIASRWSRTFEDLNLTVIVHMLNHLPEIAHIEPSRTHRAFQEMIGLGFGDAISVDAVAARNFPMGAATASYWSFAGALQRRIDFNGLDVERSALRSESDVVTGLPLASVAWITTGNVISLCLSALNVHLLAASRRGLVRLRFDQRRKRA
jgi:hypothetical protein